jgi:hypothetical protein
MLHEALLSNRTGKLHTISQTRVRRLLKSGDAKAWNFVEGRNLDNQIMRVYW